MTVAVVVPVPKWLPSFARRPLPIMTRGRRAPLFYLTAIRANLAQLSDRTILATDSLAILDRPHLRKVCTVETGTHKTLFAYALDAVERDQPKATSVVVISPLQPRFRRWHLQAMLTDHLISGRPCSAMVCPQRRSLPTDANAVHVAIGHHLRALWFSRGLIYYRPERGVDQSYWHCGVDILGIEALRRVVAHPPSSIELSEGIEHLRLIDAEIPGQCFFAPRTYPLIHSRSQLEAAIPEIGWHSQYY